jgi:hypothetical protein
VLGNIGHLGQSDDSDGLILLGDTEHLDVTDEKIEILIDFVDRDILYVHVRPLGKIVKIDVKKLFGDQSTGFTCRTSAAFPICCSWWSRPG